jgi:endo-1,4-beta-xylanase
MLVTKAMRVLVACALLLLTGGGSCLAQTLRGYADKRGLLIGTAVNPTLFAEPAYAATLAREFNLLEPENVMKWGTVRPDRATFNFKPGDQVVAFAQAHQMKVRGHCLVWSEYNPAWLAQGRFTSAQMSELLRAHITTVMQHYAGQVFAWDVVNEVFEADGHIESSIWYDQPGIGFNGRGTAYVEQAFRWARAADPHALLFYNDYDTEGLNAKSDAVYAMVKDFKRRGVPIDGVGLQMHIFNLSTKEIADLAANIARLTALGLQVHITEMDVGVSLTKAGQIRAQADLQRQARIYRFVARACLQQRGCTALQTWGFTDKYTWVPGYTKGAKGAPLLFDQTYAPKPAYKTLLAVLQQRVR